MMSVGAPTREVWAFDSFEGLPPATERDPERAGSWAGELKASEEKVREGFRRFASPERLHVVKGWFEETFPATTGESTTSRCSTRTATGTTRYG